MSLSHERLAALGTMSASQLREEWTKVFRKSPPDVSADLLARSISYRLQECAPDIVTAMLEGKQPPMLTARKMLRATGIPLCWKEQRNFFGFE